MNFGLSLPGSAAIPAPHRVRQECAYLTGKQIVEMVAADRKPSDIQMREAFLNAIPVNTAIGGSTNAPIHLNAIARHVGVELSIDDWQKYGLDVPLLLNLQPAGAHLGEESIRRCHFPVRQADDETRGLHGVAWQPVRFRNHEYQCHIQTVPHEMAVESGRSG